MKKNIIATILSATLIASLALTGCGNTSDVDSTETVVESTEEAVAVEEDATEEEFVEDETLSEESTEEVESTEVEENETESETEIKSENESESETEIKSESADATASEPAGYTYTDMSTTMYAKSTVTVRDLPSTDGKKLGSLSTNQGVAVTGQCNETGWYRIEYNGSTGYVSNKYLSDEQATAQNTTNGDTGNGASGSTAGTDAGASTDAGATNVGSTSMSTVADGFYKDIAQQIWAKVNAERAAAGENAIAWNEEIYSFACQRAQAIVNDYSHNGCGNYAENIYWGYGAPSADYIHQGWHDSPGHYANYMRQSSGVGACAVYVVNGNWYAVENFSMTAPGETITSDEAIERGLVSQSDNYTPSGTPYTASNGVTIYVEQNGTQMEYTAEAGTDMDAMLAAINEYEASIDSQ